MGLAAVSDENEQHTLAYWKSFYLHNSLYVLLNMGDVQFMLSNNNGNYISMNHCEGLKRRYKLYLTS